MIRNTIILFKLYVVTILAVDIRIWHLLKVIKMPWINVLVIWKPPLTISKRLYPNPNIRDIKSNSNLY